MSINPVPTYLSTPRWADAESSDDESVSSLADEEPTDDKSISPLANEEPTEAEQERRAQCWLRDTSLQSQLEASASQFCPAHPPSAPPAPELTPNYVDVGRLVHQDVIDA